MRDGSFLHAEERPAVGAIEKKQRSLLGEFGDAGNDFAADFNVEQSGRRGNIVIPQIVMHELLIPHEFAGRRVERDKAVVVKAVAETIAAVVFGPAAGRDGNEHQPARGVAGS